MNPALGHPYFFGAPLSAADQKRYLDARYAHRARTHPQGVDDRVCDDLEAILARVTDKSNGLLQVASIFSAVALFLQDKASTAPGVSQSGISLVLIGLVLLIVACFTLASNLGISWRAKEHALLGTRAYCQHVLELTVGRIVRFHLAMWATIGSVVLLGAQIALQYGVFTPLSLPQ